MDHNHKHDRDGNDRMKSRAKWVFIGFALVAAYFLITEHRAHLTAWLATYWIWLLLLACPLLHIFMHGGHGHGGGHDHGDHGKGEKRE